MLICLVTIYHTHLKLCYCITVSLNLAIKSNTFKHILSTTFSSTGFIWTTCRDVGTPPIKSPTVPGMLK